MRHVWEEPQSDLLENQATGANQNLTITTDGRSATLATPDGNTVPETPTHLTLKTKKFKMVPEDKENTSGEDKPSWTNGILSQFTKQSSRGESFLEDDEPLAQGGQHCAICLTPFEDGQRIGDIECCHEFHVSCLKQWLRFKNYCPLCKEENIATPQFHGKGPE